MDVRDFNILIWRNPGLGDLPSKTQLLMQLLNTGTVGERYSTEVRMCVEYLAERTQVIQLLKYVIPAGSSTGIRRKTRFKD